MFVIDSNNGTVIITGLVDFERRPSYTLQVRGDGLFAGACGHLFSCASRPCDTYLCVYVCLCVCASGECTEPAGKQVSVSDNGGLSTTTTLTLTVENVNEPPFFLESPSLVRRIKELPEVAVGDALNTLVDGALVPTSVDVRDQESGAVTFSIAPSRFSPFFSLSTPVYVSALRTTQVFVVVANASVLDNESLFPDFSIQLTITAVDQGGLSVNISLVLAVEDVNEVPVAFNQVRAATQNCAALVSLPGSGRFVWSCRCFACAM